MTNADDIAEVRALRARLSELEQRAESGAAWNAALRRAAHPPVDPAAELLGLDDYMRDRRAQKRWTAEMPKAQKETDR